MNPLSLREICATATKGPWTAHESLAHNGEFAIQADIGPDIARLRYNCAKANARLIARFRPETALAVYEALEGVLRVADRKTNEFDAVRRVLALLDGRTEP